MRGCFPGVIGIGGGPGKRNIVGEGADFEDVETGDGVCRALIGNEQAHAIPANGPDLHARLNVGGRVRLGGEFAVAADEPGACGRGGGVADSGGKDGRGANGHLGATASDLIEIMDRYGAVNAANLDGGSSTCMYYNGEWLQNSVTFYYATTSWRIPTSFLVK